MFPLILVLLAFATAASSQPQPPPNYDESLVKPYTLPDPLTFTDGRKVKTAADWTSKRRAEVLALFETQVYGRTPRTPPAKRFETLRAKQKALGGNADWKEIRVWLKDGPEAPYLDLLLILPAGTSKPVPVFLGLSFGGNHTITPDPDVRLSTRWMRSREDGNRATEASRGQAASRWSIDQIVKAGFGLATFYYGDLFPDHTGGFKESVIPHFTPGEPTPDDWNAIGAWAFGVSRAIDYLMTDRAVDAKRIAIIGHSRLGKTALWAAAQDQRVALAIANNSGEGGAALARRNYGETTEHLNKSFPHWFDGNFKRYSGAPEKLPVDQHMLIALIAPRPVYLASASEDQWADPRGEFLAAKAASPVYKLLGTDGFTATEMPALHTPVKSKIGYHIRAGKHDVTAYDWEQFIAFARRHLL